ncbi:hypothetical protein GEV33_004269 [Tenebrio molitor]|uniref:Uncharacterized protein n=1 Tax=Tenebrio molitor TaxID=7067 RepID=A0A8J6HQ37_TENMO|nr:hypothetical protein GEV33_004269 [Tenebrio molitor]
MSQKPSTSRWVGAQQKLTRFLPKKITQKPKEKDPTDEDIELINKKLGPPGPEPKGQPGTEPKGQSGPRTARTRSHQYRQYKKPPGPPVPGPPITGQDYVTRNPHSPPCLHC